MGTISSGVGIMSGMDIQAIVSQLMAIEQRPKDLISQRIKTITAQQTAFMTLQAKIMALQLSASNFNKESVFQQKAVNVSDEDVLSVTADKNATLGSYAFRVKQLATNHHLVTGGYSSLNSNFGIGTVSFEIGNGQVGKSTDLSFINGQQGFQRGTITIDDRAGNSSEIDLSAVLTVTDVLDKINADTTVNVTASVDGDSIVITDNNSAATGTLSITGQPAQSLGIAGTTSGTETKIIGSDIHYLTAETKLDQLNDGLGIRGLGYGADLIFSNGTEDFLSVDIREKMYKEIGEFSAENSTTLQSLNSGQGIRLGKFRITDQNGRVIDIDLNELAQKPELQDKPVTLTHVEEFIQEKVTEKNAELNPSGEPDFKGMDISFVFGSADHITVTDNSKPFSNNSEAERKSHFIVEDLDGGYAAADLGIVDDISGDNIHGEVIWKMETLGDLVNAVNNHWDNWDSSLVGDDKRLVQLSIDQTGDNVLLNYNGSGTLSLSQTDTAVDLGLIDSDGQTLAQGRRLIAGLNTVMLRSLNGGNAGSNQITHGGQITITDRDGNNSTIDLTHAFTVQDVINAINADENINVTASANKVGNGIKISDNSTGSGNLIIDDAAGSTLAQQLNLTVNDAVSSVDSGNLQLQYISEATRLDDYRNGGGVRLGEFHITDNNGQKYTVDISNAETIGDVIDKIKLVTPDTIVARINDNGDGLVIIDVPENSPEDSEGNPLFEQAPLKITDVDGGYAAYDLGLLGPVKQNADGFYQVDGSLEFKLEVGGGDTIDDVVARINDADIGIKASIINDGSANSPYRLSFNSEVSGRAGSVYIDPGQTSLNTQTLSEAQDAIVLMGGGDEQSAFLVSSSSNTLKNIISGTTLELKSTSDSPVDITISEDLDSIVEQMNSFVGAYNAIMDDIDANASFNPTTFQRGLLFTEHTVYTAKSILQTLPSRVVSGLQPPYNMLSSIGISFAPLGYETGTDAAGETSNFAVATTPKLAFDETKFRDAFEDNPDAVTELFTKAETGIGDYIAGRLNELADNTESTMKRRVDAMQSQQRMFEKRIEYLDEILANKEDRLYKQFYAMEEALAGMQSQQAALGGLSAMAASISKSFG